MQHIWSVLCSQSITDKTTNSISLLGCVEQVDVKFTGKNTIIKNEKSVIAVNFEFIHLFFKDDEKEKEFEIKTELYNPNNKKVDEFTAKFLFPKDKRRFRAHIKLSKAPIILTGKYEFKITFKEKKQAKYSKAAVIPVDISIK